MLSVKSYTYERFLILNNKFITPGLLTEKGIQVEYFCSVFSQKILTDLKTNFTKFELSTTFFRKAKLLSQYCQNGNTKVTGKSLTLNCNILKTARRGKLKFGGNAF